MLSSFHATWKQNKREGVQEQGWGCFNFLNHICRVWSVTFSRWSLLNTKIWCSCLVVTSIIIMIPVQSWEIKRQLHGLAVMISVSTVDNGQWLTLNFGFSSSTRPMRAPLLQEMNTLGMPDVMRSKQIWWWTWTG